jgi:hypothetical protein
MALRTLVLGRSQATLPVPSLDLEWLERLPDLVLQAAVAQLQLALPVVVAAARCDGCKAEELKKNGSCLRGSRFEKLFCRP